MMNKLLAVAICAAIASQGACTSKAKNIKPEFVSPRLYSAYECDELFEENRKIQDKVDDLVGRQKSNRTTDTVMTTVGIVIFWPALLALPFTKDRKVEIARLMGEAEAIKENIATKRCAYRSEGRDMVEGGPAPDAPPVLVMKAADDQPDAAAVPPASSEIKETPVAAPE